ncbi:FecR family protein [Dyadobacter diqingensis]|uniref:FecR family protein n=1 Tax=Dyadobacter diqingensis TaxID=2938121 RepID=UPI0020C199E3|nr:FecR family protein [Dyadobacter diqingensis]
MKEDRSLYQLNDFIADDSFKEWVLRKSTSAFWDNYLAQYPSQQPVVSDAKKLILSLKASQQSEEDDRVVEEIWKNIKKGTVKKSRIVVLRPVFFRVAAAIAVFAICFIGYQLSEKRNTMFRWAGDIAGLSNMTKEINTSGKSKNLVLSDGSVVVLENNSSLKYSQDFNLKTRTVYLQGKAFFDVAKNAEKPFIIYSNGLVTKVLGTSFTITANEDDKDVTVSVVTGKVAVLLQDQFETIPEKHSSVLSGLLLTPNQKAVYSRRNAHLAKTLVDNPVLVDKASKTRDFTFENTPVNEVFEVLSKAYGINLVYDKTIFENCSLIVGLEDEGLYDKLRVICKTLNATYKVMGSEILIEGKGCK